MTVSVQSCIARELCWGKLFPGSISIVPKMNCCKLW